MQGASRVPGSRELSTTERQGNCGSVARVLLLFFLSSAWLASSTAIVRATPTPDLVSISLGPEVHTSSNDLVAPRMGTVTLSMPAPAGGATVSLASSNPAGVRVLESVTVPAGTASASFRLVITGLGTSAKIFAAYGNRVVSVTVNVLGLGGPPIVRPRIPPRINNRDLPALYRPSTGEWIIRREGMTQAPERYPGWIPEAWSAYEPIPHDYTGAGWAQLALYDSMSRVWVIRKEDGTWTAQRWGEVTARHSLLPADYLGKGYAQLGVYDRGTGWWSIDRISPFRWGEPPLGGESNGDVAVPGNYELDRRVEPAVYRPGSGEWFVRSWDNRGGAFFLPTWDGRGFRLKVPSHPDDIPVPAVYDDTELTRLACYCTHDQMWRIWDRNGNLLREVGFGQEGDQPVPADYLGLGYAQLAIYRDHINDFETSSEWIVMDPRPNGTGIVTYRLGEPGDIPVPAAYRPLFGPR
jgi:hypothetical protein